MYDAHLAVLAFKVDMLCFGGLMLIICGAVVPANLGRRTVLEVLWALVLVSMDGSMVGRRGLVFQSAFQPLESVSYLGGLCLF